MKTMLAKVFLLATLLMAGGWMGRNGTVAAETANLQNLKMQFDFTNVSGTSVTDPVSGITAKLVNNAKVTAFLSFPLLFGFALVAVEFITYALTDKWLQSARFIQILSISGAFMPLVTVFQNAILSHGKSAVYMVCTITLSCCLIGMVLAFSDYGVRTLVIGFTILQLIWVFVWHFFVWRITGYTLGMFLWDILPFAVTAASVMLTVHFLTRSIESEPLLLATRVPLAAILYYLVMKCARAKVLDECTTFILQRLHKKKKQ